jgi:hypothetical protein
MTATFRIIIPLVLSIYLTTSLAPYARVTSLPCATAEISGMCRCAVETQDRLYCCCQHMNHKANAGPGVVDAFRLAQNSVKPTVLARYCSCRDGNTPVLPGLEVFEHLLSRLSHDIMQDEVYFRVPCAPPLYSRPEEPPEHPPPERDNGRHCDSVGSVNLPKRTIC